MTVHFTGPVLFAGKDGQRKWFADLPVSNNPDYVVYMDDFTGIAIDKTNDWTELKDTNATVAIGADVLGGVVVLTSEATTDNDGASIQGNEIFAVAADRDVWFETKLFITDAECKTEKNGTETSTDSGVDIVSGTYVTLGFHVKSVGAVEFFVNRNLVATHTTNIPDDENLAIGAMELSGSATGTKSMTIDYLFAAQSR
jgi:hypothetical protein